MSGPALDFPMFRLRDRYLKAVLRMGAQGETTAYVKDDSPWLAPMADIIALVRKRKI